MPPTRSHRSLNLTVLVAVAFLRSSGRPHIIRRFEEVDEPMSTGLCGTETVSLTYAEAVRVGDHAGALCQRCFNLFLHNWDSFRLPYHPS